jgi:hypothetical protein
MKRTRSRSVPVDGRSSRADNASVIEEMRKIVARWELDKDTNSADEMLKDYVIPSTVKW